MALLASRSTDRPLSVPHEDREALCYLERVHVALKGGRIVYERYEGEDTPVRHPLAAGNVACLLLGPGSTITQGAVVHLSQHQVCVGFTGEAGTGHAAATPPTFLNGAGALAPTTYCQSWCTQWTDMSWRVAASAHLLRAKWSFLFQSWDRGQRFLEHGPLHEDRALRSLREKSLDRLQGLTTLADLRALDAEVDDALWQAVRRHTAPDKLSVKDQRDIAERRLMAEQLHLSMGALAAWIHGLPPAFALSHGMRSPVGLATDLANMIALGMSAPLIYQYRERPVAELRTAISESHVRDAALTFLSTTLRELL